MKIQVNSDKTINVDASLTRFVKEKSTSALDGFTNELTRRGNSSSATSITRRLAQRISGCSIEVRVPAGDQPLVASSDSKTTDTAVDAALGKMKRLLTTFFGKKGRPAAQISALGPKATKTAVVVRRRQQ